MVPHPDRRITPAAARDAHYAALLADALAPGLADATSLALPPSFFGAPSAGRPGWLQWSRRKAAGTLASAAPDAGHGTLLAWQGRDAVLLDWAGAELRTHLLALAALRERARLHALISPKFRCHSCPRYPSRAGAPGWSVRPVRGGGARGLTIWAPDGPGSGVRRASACGA